MPTRTARPPPTPPSHPSSNKPLTLEEWDVPCLNCGRFGTIPGQMITDAFNNTFCSPDCGWSHLLRPLETQRQRQKQVAARAAAAAMTSRRGSAQLTGAAPRTRRSGHDTRGRSGRRYGDKRRDDGDRRRDGGRRVSRSSAAADAPERPAEVIVHSGNAMFDFNMMGGLELE